MKRFVSRPNGFLFFGITFFILASQMLQVAGQKLIPPDSLVRIRLQTLQRMLTDGQSGANRWWTGWLAGYSGATLAQLSVMAGSHHLDTRQDMALGVATTFLGAAGQLLLPLGPGYFPKSIKNLPETTPEARREKVRQLELLLEKDAELEKLGISWKTHAMTGVVNLSSGLITWFGFHRDFRAGLENFLLNTAITEAQIFTQPRRAIRDLEKYREMQDHPVAWSKKRPDVIWCFRVIPGGISIQVFL